MTKHETVPIQLIPLTQIIESPWNPRKHFDPVKEAGMAASIKTHGQLTVALVRPIAGGNKYELAAGHRRFRGAKAAGLGTLRCEVREMTDAAFCEILGIENDEREDVHPLDQAESYKLLMFRSNYTVAKIAERINREHTYVYDRIALLQLLPELKELFLADRFALAHAVVLAKLSDDEQRKASRRPQRQDGSDSGLWRQSGATLDDKVFPLVAKTSKELEGWIARNLRFDESKVLLEEMFPETAHLIESAAETGTRIVAITYDEYLPQQIERDPQDKIYTASFWERADGEDGSKVCDYAVVGVVKAGKGRGTSMGVCVSRDRCTTHWAANVKKRLQREKEKKSGTKTGAKHDPKAAAKQLEAEKRGRAAALKQNIAKSRLLATIPLIDAALGEIIKAPNKATLERARQILGGKNWAKQSIESTVVAVAMQKEIHSNLEWALANTHQSADTIKQLGSWGVNITKLSADVVVELCTYCGCSEQNACRLRHGDWDTRPCKWHSTATRVCTNPVCIAQSKGEAVATLSKRDAADLDEDDDAGGED